MRRSAARYGIRDTRFGIGNSGCEIRDTGFPASPFGLPATLFELRRTRRRGKRDTRRSFVGWPCADMEIGATQRPDPFRLQAEGLQDLSPGQAFAPPWVDPVHSPPLRRPFGASFGARQMVRSRRVQNSWAHASAGVVPCVFYTCQHGADLPIYPNESALITYLSFRFGGVGYWSECLRGADNVPGSRHWREQFGVSHHGADESRQWCMDGHPCGDSREHGNRC